MYKNDYAFVSKNYIILGGTQTGGTQTVTNLNNFLFIIKNNNIYKYNKEWSDAYEEKERYKFN